MAARSHAREATPGASNPLSGTLARIEAALAAEGLSFWLTASGSGGGEAGPLAPGLAAIAAFSNSRLPQRLLLGSGRPQPAGTVRFGLQGRT